VLYFSLIWRGPRQSARTSPIAAFQAPPASEL